MVLYVLTLSTLDKSFQQTTFWNIFYIFLRKQDLTFHANCLLMRQFAWIVKFFFVRRHIVWSVESYFLGKIRKNSTNFLSAELAKRVVKVKPFHPPKKIINLRKQCSCRWRGTYQDVSSVFTLFASLKIGLAQIRGWKSIHVLKSERVNKWIQIFPTLNIFHSFLDFCLNF